MIVVDLGSQEQEGHDSIPKLIKRFKPTHLWAFDPLAEPRTLLYDGGVATISNAAAWTHDGVIELGVGGRGLDATLMPDKTQCGEWQQTMLVRCFDFSAWLSMLVEPAVVKMDIEGAEYDLLEYIIADGSDSKISLLLVEWHDHWMDEPAYYQKRRYDLCDHFAGRWEGWI